MDCRKKPEFTESPGRRRELRTEHTVKTSCNLLRGNCTDHCNIAAMCWNQAEKTTNEREMHTLTGWLSNSGIC